MANTSGLKQVTDYILGELSEKMGVRLYRQKIRIGQGVIEKEFTGVSKDKDIVISICHNKGRTNGGNVPSAKLDILFAKCYFMEKISAEQKYIYFTNKEFYEIFCLKSSGIIDGIELRLFDGLPNEHKHILDAILQNASNEMS